MRVTVSRSAPRAAISLIAADLGLSVFVASFGAHAEQIGPYSSRNLTLGSGTVRIDGGPPDWGYFHPGGPQWINENRGLRIRHQPDTDPVWIGGGIGVGVTDDVELGGLLLPVRVTPDSDLDDLELYARFAFLDGTFEMAGQVTVQVPTQTETGLGLGLPMLIHVGDVLRIDTGAEAEILFWEDTVVSLDLPLAFTWDLGQRGFLGLRTGAYFWDMATLTVPAGIHGGGILGSGQVDLAGWFIWPGFLATERDDALDVNTFELGFGVNARID